VGMTANDPDPGPALPASFGRLFLIISLDESPEATGCRLDQIDPTNVTRADIGEAIAPSIAWRSNRRRRLNGDTSLPTWIFSGLNRCCRHRGGCIARHSCAFRDDRRHLRGNSKCCLNDLLN